MLTILTVGVIVFTLLVTPFAGFCPVFFSHLTGIAKVMLAI